MSERYFYQIADLTVDSDYCLDYAFSTDADGTADVTIRRMQTQPTVYEAVKKRLHNTSGMVYKYNEREAVYGYADRGFFRVAEGCVIEYFLEAEVNPAWVVQIILCQCFGAIIAQRGMIGIHGSVCFWKNRAFIICGESGAGKSTLTANLLQRGVMYMADDTACVEVSEHDIVVKSLVPLRKLCLDALEKADYAEEQIVTLAEPGKKGVREPECFHLGVEPLRAMFYLKKGDVSEVEYRELQGVEKLKALTANFFAQGGYEKPLKEPEFAKKIFAFCNNVPIFEVVRPGQGDSGVRCVQVVEEIMNTIG